MKHYILHISHVAYCYFIYYSFILPNEVVINTYYRNLQQKKIGVNDSF